MEDLEVLYLVHKKMNAILLIVSVVIIILFSCKAGKLEASAKESDFTIEAGVLKQYLGSENEIVIPQGVKTIGTGAFKGCMMEKIIIPNTVNIIENEAFQNCSKLTEILIPNSVGELGQSSFQGCSSLYRVELCSALHIGMSAFEDCTSLKKVIIPDGVKALGYYAFRNCTSLEIIDLPESIVAIGGGCFENCTSLETILFPTKDIIIEQKAFNNTQWLDNYEGDYVMINHTLILYRGNETDVTIPNKITVIGDGAFENRSFITNVNIPMGVREIGISAFEGCKGLTEIVLPDSVTIVNTSAFNGCSNLAKIDMPKVVNISRDSLEGTKWMADFKGDFIILNDNLLGYQGTDSKVVIPDNITKVGTSAFDNNNFITEITVPKSVTNIYYAGFFYCHNLQKVIIINNNTKLEYDSFINCSSDLQLYSLAGGAVEEYAGRNNIPFVNYGLNRTKVTLYLGGKNTTILSIGDTESEIQWESEDATIAIVSKSGKVTAIKKGTTKVNAMVNGITMTCEITVKNPFISKNSVSILVGKTSRLNIVGISSVITWSSSNKSVAVVNKSGVITAKKKGTATITATINGKKYTCKVTVK